MYDSAITVRTLRGVLRRSDFIRSPKLRDDRARATLLRMACRLARRRPTNYLGAIRSAKVRGKIVNFVSSIPLELTIRKLNANLRYANHIRAANRTELVRAICEGVRDSNAFTLLRLDIKSFYESVTPNQIFDSLESNPRIGAATLRLLKGINDWHFNQGGSGLPRGLATSATLSELCLAEFDRRLRNNKAYFYYGRYADDMLLIGSPDLQEKTTYRAVRSQLPSGLTLNPSKSKFYSIPKSGSNTDHVLTFEYLGYEVRVFNQTGKETRRRTQVDIAESKRRRMKTRVVKAFESYISNSDFDLLKLRIRFLTGNYRILDKNGKFSRFAGIHFNYPLVNHEHSQGLRDLDLFLRKAILSGKGKVFFPASTMLTKAQKRELLAHSFLKGFVAKTIRHFSPKAISKIQSCWKYA